MFIKLTASGPRRYVQLVEAYRDELGRPKQRTVATLGRADRLGELDGLITEVRQLHPFLTPFDAPTPSAINNLATRSPEIL